MKVTLITPTGGRPEAFRLCEDAMLRQTVDWDEWIVVDDYETRTETTMEQVVIHPDENWQPGDKTLARNIRLAWERVTGDMVLFIEDDDYYAPNYIERMVDKLKYFDIVGESRAKYYHLPTRRYQQLNNDTHASLCQTGLRVKSMDNTLRGSLHSNTPFFDMMLWKLSLEQSSLISSYLYPGSVGCVGIKGLPGRPGIGMGHNPPESWNVDTDKEILKKWVGHDWLRYEKYLGE